MHEQTKKDIELLIKDNLQKIKSQKPKTALRESPNLLNDIKKKNVEQIKMRIDELKRYNEELLPFIKKIKTQISDITDQTHLCSIYLLLCFGHQTWQSIYILAQKGFYSQTMALLRTIKESSMLCDLFSLENRQNKDKHLKKWLSGKIVSHSEGRTVVNDFVEESSPYPNFNLEQLQSHIYQMESQIPHCAYAGIIENISPFSENFDFEEYTSFRRTISALGYARGAMDNMNIALKGIYIIMLNDPVGCTELNTILIKYSPDYRNKAVSKDILEKFKK